LATARWLITSRCAMTALERPSASGPSTQAGGGSGSPGPGTRSAVPACSSLIFLPQLPGQDDQ
jgi:hypothetical protein